LNGCSYPVWLAGGYTKNCPNWIPGMPGVNQVTCDDLSITVSPITGNVVLHINLSHLNHWLIGQVIQSAGVGNIPLSLIGEATGTTDILECFNSALAQVALIAGDGAISSSAEIVSTNNRSPTSYNFRAQNGSSLVWAVDNTGQTYSNQFDASGSLGTLAGVMQFIDLASGDPYLLPVFNLPAPLTPTVTSVSPSSGSTSGGTSVTVNGTNLNPGGTVTCDFGPGNPGTITGNTGSSITVNSPATSTGVVDVTVTTVNGTSPTGSFDHFTFTTGPTVILLDDFTDTNGTLLASHTPTPTPVVGVPWVVGSGGFWIQSNVCQVIAGGSGQYATYNVGITDFVLTFTIMPGAATSAIGAWFRFSDFNNNWFLEVTGGTMSVYSAVGGSYTSMGSVSCSYAAGVAFTFTITCTGSSLTITTSAGPGLGPITMLTNLSNTNVGFYVSSGTGGEYLSSFEVQS